MTAQAPPGHQGTTQQRASASVPIRRRGNVIRIRVVLGWPLILAPLVLGSAPCAAADPASPGVNLSGSWQTSDYECPTGVKHTERLQITQDGTHISAVKTLGDNCIPTGHESFSGTVTGNSGKVQSWLGAPGYQPVLSSSDEDLVILDANTFKVSGTGNNLTATRVTNSN